MTDMRLLLLRSATPEHTISTESRTTYCGDHYCSGHRTRVFVCTCGEERYGGEVYDGGRYYGPSLEEFELEHLAAVARQAVKAEDERKRGEALVEASSGKPGTKSRTSPLAEEGR